MKTFPSKIESPIVKKKNQKCIQALVKQPGLAYLLSLWKRLNLQRFIDSLNFIRSVFIKKFQSLRPKAKYNEIIYKIYINFFISLVFFWFSHS